MFRKTLALGVTLLFLGTIFVPAISGDTSCSGKTLDVENIRSTSTAVSESTSVNSASSSTASKASRTGSTSFAYGPLGNRISSTDTNGDTTFHLYEGTNVIQDRQQDGALAREYVSGIGSKLAMIDHTDDGNKPAVEDEVLYYLHDILGSVVVLTNANGNHCERYYYDPYGETVITDFTGTIERDESLFGNFYMWTGKQYDSANELYHFPARTYSPSLGRWLQRDPLGHVDGLNLYEYVRSNPLRFIDPLGIFGTESKWKGQMKARYPELASVVDRSSKEGSDLAVDYGSAFAPGVGDVRDITEFATGKEWFTGRELAGWEKGVTFIAMMAPIVSGKLLRRSGQRILTQAEVAKELTVSKITVHRMVKKGVLPKRITEDALLEFMIKHDLPFFSEMGKLDTLSSAGRHIGVSAEEVKLWILHGHLKGHYFPGSGGELIFRISHDEVVRFKQKYGRAIARRGNPNYVNAGQASDLIGVGGSHTVCEWIKHGAFKGYGVLRLPGARLGGNWIIPRTQLYDFAVKYHFPRDGIRGGKGNWLNRLDQPHKYPRTNPLYILDTNVFTRPS